MSLTLLQNSRQSLLMKTCQHRPRPRPGAFHLERERSVIPPWCLPSIRSCSLRSEKMTYRLFPECIWRHPPMHGALGIDPYFDDRPVGEGRPKISKWPTHRKRMLHTEWAAKMLGYSKTDDFIIEKRVLVNEQGTSRRHGCRMDVSQQSCRLADAVAG